MRCVGLVALLLMLAGCQTEKSEQQKKVPTKAPDSATARVVQKAVQAAPSPEPSPVPAQPLPPSDRIFAVDLDGDGVDELVGTDDSSLWAGTIVETGIVPLWTQNGVGVVQRVTAGQLGGRHRVFVARGTGRGHINKPLSVYEVDAKTGALTKIWHYQGERNECAHLSISDVDRDGEAELAFAYYSSKYTVRPRHFEADGKGASGEELRMGSARVYGDVNGSGGADELIGRVYGDARGLPGDLKIDLGKGLMTIATDNGVRALTYGRIGSDSQARLYVADGWVANYGKEAKAQLKSLNWTKEGPVLELVGRSASDFTFFDMVNRDVDGDGQLEIIARGNKYVTVFDQTDKGWQQRVVGELPPVLNCAIAQSGPAKSWELFVPGRPSTVRKAFLK